jgi:hypothetical protein
MYDGNNPVHVLATDRRADDVLDDVWTRWTEMDGRKVYVRHQGIVR